MRLIRQIQRVRTSTWILIAIFLGALTAYVYLAPPATHDVDRRRHLDDGAALSYVHADDHADGYADEVTDTDGHADEVTVPGRDAAPDRRAYRVAVLAGGANALGRGLTLAGPPRRCYCMSR